MAGLSGHIFPRLQVLRRPLDRSFGLNDEQISAMLQASFSHAEQDKQARQLAEQRLEAQQLLEGLEIALAADGDALLAPDECARLHQKMSLV